MSRTDAMQKFVLFCIIFVLVSPQVFILYTSTRYANELENSEVIDIMLMTKENIPKDEMIQITGIDLVFDVKKPFKKDNVVEHIEDFDSVNMNLKNEGIINRKELDNIEQQLRDSIIGVKHKTIIE